MKDRKSMPSNVVSFASNPNTFKPVKHTGTKNRNIYIPTSLYWSNREQINLPYLPYFSNCKGYGLYIPFWSLME